MRLAWVGPAPADTGGVPGVARLVLPALAKAGCEVDCYVVGDEAELPPEVQVPGLTFTWADSGWRWDRWYSRGPLRAFVTGQLSRGLAMRRLLGRLASADAITPYDALYQFSSIELFGRRFLRRSLPIIVHPQTHAAGELRWLLREWRLAVRARHWHRLPLAVAVFAVRTIIQAWAARSVDGWICISDRFRQHLAEDYRIPKHRMRVLPSPVDLTRFTPPLVDERRAPPLALFAGRLASRKGVETIVEMSRGLGTGPGRPDLVVAGHPSQWSDYTALLGALGPGARFIGALAPTALADLMASADVFVAPSHYEPFGLTVAEALASGTPVVTTTEMGSAEQIARGAVVVVEPGDAKALTAATLAMVERMAGPDRRAIRSLARSEATRRFDPDHIGVAIADALRSLVSVAR